MTSVINSAINKCWGYLDPMEWDVETRLKVYKYGLGFISSATCVLVPCVVYVSSDSMVLLGTEGMFAMGGAFCLRLYCKYRSRLASTYPHYSFYKGTVFTQFEYVVKAVDLDNPPKWQPKINQFLLDVKLKAVVDLWLNAKNFSSVEEGALYLALRLPKGTCYGKTIELFTLVLENSRASCAQLMGKWKLENAVYFQIIHSVISDCLQLKGREFVDLVITRSLKRTNNAFHSYSIDDVFFELMKFDRVVSWSPGNQMDWLRIDSLNIRSLNALFMQAHDELQMDVVGILNLLPNTSGKPAHALFFQFVEGYYRFHDFGKDLSGFFEFPTSQEFVDGVVQHLETSESFRDGELKISFYGIIPKRRVLEA